MGCEIVLCRTRDRRYAASRATARTARPMTPERSSRASASLAKASEAVLFAAMIRPRTDRASSVRCRRDQYWYPANAAAVSSRTSPLIDTSIAVSFCWIGQSRSAISASRRRDHLGHPQQLGADRQVGRFRRRRVDLQPDAAAVGHEPDHAAPLGESVGVAHREDGPVLETRDDLLRRISRGLTDEQDVAPRDVVHPLITMDGEGPRSATLPADGGVEEVAERILAQNPDDQGRLRIRNGLRRPIDELREVEQENGLYLRLGGLRRLRSQPGRAHQQYSGRDLQKRHATAP